MMALINNWDLKDSNNGFLSDGELAIHHQRSRRYVWPCEYDAAGFWRLTRSRNNPSKYAKAKFFKEVKAIGWSCTSVARTAGLMKDITLRDGNG